MEPSFAIDMRIVHPCYGAGTVVRLDHKTIGGTTNAYYVIHTLARAMDLMVPVRRADEVGLRPVGTAEALRTCLLRCSVAPTLREINADLRARQTTMRDDLKSGEYAAVVEIARQLYFLNSRRPLGTVDRQMYDQAKEFLAAELALASDLPYENAQSEIEDCLGSMFIADADDVTDIAVPDDDVEDDDLLDEDEEALDED